MHLCACALFAIALLAEFLPAATSQFVKFDKWVKNCRMCRLSDVKCKQLPGARSSQVAEVEITLPALVYDDGVFMPSPERLQGCDGAKTIIFRVLGVQTLVFQIGTDFFQMQDRNHLTTVERIGFRGAVFKLCDISPWVTWFGPHKQWVYGEKDVVVMPESQVVTKAMSSKAVGILQNTRRNMLKVLTNEYCQRETEIEDERAEIQETHKKRSTKESQIRESIERLENEVQQEVANQKNKLQKFVDNFQKIVTSSRRKHQQTVEKVQATIDKYTSRIVIHRQVFAKEQSVMSQSLNATISELQITIADLTANEDAHVLAGINSTVKQCLADRESLSKQIQDTEGKIEKAKFTWTSSLVPVVIATGVGALTGSHAGKTKPPFVVEETFAPTAFMKGASLAAVATASVNGYVRHLSAKADMEIKKIKGQTRPPVKRAGQMTLLYLILGLTGAVVVLIAIGAAIHKKLTNVPTMSGAIPLRILEL